MKPKRSIIVHPFLLAAYSVLGVFVQNSDTLPISQLFRPLAIVVLLSGLIYFLLLRSSRDPDRAGYLATLVVLWILFFGHLYRFAAFSAAIRSIPEYRLVLFIVWTLILGLLPDRSFYSAFFTPYQFVEVTGQVEQACRFR